MSLETVVLSLRLTLGEVERLEVEARLEGTGRVITGHEGKVMFSGAFVCPQVMSVAEGYGTCFQLI